MTVANFFSWAYKFESYLVENPEDNKGADQTLWIRKLICAFVVSISDKHVFSWCSSKEKVHELPKSAL